MSSDGKLVFPAEAWVRTLVRQSLQEDVGAGDASTRVSVAPAARAKAEVVARGDGVAAGLPLLEMVYHELDTRVKVQALVSDGSPVLSGGAVAEISGPAGAILTGERTALNFLQHLGGIATATARYVTAVAGTGCRVLDTRKTLPGYRVLAKYAVRCGGGYNHRMGLDDRIMLKDNHWLVRQQGMVDVVARARREYPHLAVEIEVDDLEQLGQILPLGVEWILLDNFNVQDTASAVGLRDAVGVKTRLESSGNVNLDTVAGYARAGVDAVSVGRLTHSVCAWDLGLDFERPGGGRG